MNHGPLIFLGVFATCALSWFGMIVTPQLQIGNEQATNLPPANVLYPTAPAGLAQQGREVYRANGCQYCHTQVVRHNGYTPANLRTGDFGPDFARGWGVRNSVSRDYLYESPLMLGWLRIGPDLKNIGERQTNEVWHLLHLYNPQITSKGSVMPPYPYLFTKRPIKTGQAQSPEALVLAGEFAPESGYEIVPKGEAIALVNYLLSLQSDIALFEAPWAPKPKADTNATPSEAGSTNLPPK